MVAMLAPAAVAAGVLDQEYVVQPDGYAGFIDSDGGRAQTFTVGRTGQLDRLELQVARSSMVSKPLVVEFRRTLPGGVPDFGTSALRASLSLTPTSVPASPVTAFTTDFLRVDLGTQAFDVTAGEELAIVLSSTAPDNTGLDWYSWATSNPDATPPAPQYRGGEVYWELGPPGPQMPARNQDSGFRTFVVPEPTALGLAAGIMLILCRRSR
jgi:hypothetical protein